MDDFKIHLNLELKINTSGYSDRYLTSNASFKAEVTKNKKTATHRYRDRDELFEGLQQIFCWEPKEKKDFIKYITLIRERTTTSRYISGKTDRRTFCSLVMSGTDYKSILMLF